MATTKTTKIANAISLLSDVLSDEVAEENHFLEDEDDSVPVEDHDALREAANDFITTQISELEDIQMEMQGAVDAVADVIFIQEEALQETHEMAVHVDTKFIKGVVMTKDEMVILLDIDHLLSKKEFDQLVNTKNE